jgi:hypothetical protein
LIRLGYSESGSVTKLLKLTKALQAIITWDMTALNKGAVFYLNFKIDVLR